MFDCPEQSQSSPNTTSSIVFDVLPSEHVSFRTVRFGKAGRVTVQRPVESAFARSEIACADAPGFTARPVTVIAAPGSDLPAMSFAFPACRTIRLW